MLNRREESCKYVCFEHLTRFLDYQDLGGEALHHQSRDMLLAPLTLRTLGSFAAPAVVAPRIFVPLSTCTKFCQSVTSVHSLSRSHEPHSGFVRERVLSPHAA